MYTCVPLELWYDAYKVELGDGFYPQVQPNANYQSIIVEFELDGSKWVQLDGPCIDGLYGEFGRDLLYELNWLAKTNVSQLYNKAGQLIFPKPK